MNFLRSLFVIAGLDPAIHLYRKSFFMIDARGGPSHDISGVN